MPYLARKISRGKWPDKEGVALKDIGSDAITADLRSTTNQISVWHVETVNKEDINKAILALATSPKIEKIEKISLVLLDEDKIKEGDLTVVESNGDTVIESLQYLHRDISELTYEKLGKLADEINHALNDDENTSGYYQCTKKDVGILVVEAYRSGKITDEMISEKLLGEIKKNLVVS